MMPMSIIASTSKLHLCPSGFQKSGSTSDFLMGETLPFPSHFRTRDPISVNEDLPVNRADAVSFLCKLCYLFPTTLETRVESMCTYIFQMIVPTRCLACNLILEYRKKNWTKVPILHGDGLYLVHPLPWRFDNAYLIFLVENSQNVWIFPLGMVK